MGLIERSIPPKTLTFLSSNEYLKVPVRDKDNNLIKGLDRYVLESASKVSVLTGSPGSGKSVLVRKLFQDLGGLNQSTREKRVDLLIKNNSLPLLINFKDCVFDSVETLIRNKKAEFDLTLSKFGFVYLFDGLDELNEGCLESVLSYLHSLSLSEPLSRLVITCRKGNFNKIRLKTYFSSLNEVTIGDLSGDEVEEYFIGKGDDSKLLALKSMRGSNPGLIGEVKDILLADLLWQSAERVSSGSSVIDLFGMKVDQLLDSPNHIGGLNDLNLLNPKKEKVVDILQDISFEFHDKRKNKFQFRFYMSDIQSLVNEALPRIDYRDVNNIINYISDLFFDASETIEGRQSETYIFRHRRYQEYFFVQRLKTEYEKDPSILRGLKVISSNDFFEGLFLPYLRSEYCKGRNLKELTGINLLDVYLGNHSGYGVDETDFFGSDEFLGSLLYQSESVYEEILGDDDLNIAERLYISLELVREVVKKVNSDDVGDSFSVEDEFKCIWEEDIPELIRCITRFWKSGRSDVSIKLQENLSLVMECIESSGIGDKVKSNLNHPYWIAIEDIIFIKVVIKGESLSSVLDSVVRANYENVSGGESYSYRESGKDKLINSFLRVAVSTGQSGVAVLIDLLDEEELSHLYPMLLEPEIMGVLFSDEGSMNKVKDLVCSLKSGESIDELCVAALKKNFDILIDDPERQFVTDKWEEVRKERPMDWSYKGLSRVYAISSYVLNKHSFQDMLKPQSGHSFRYYNEQALYSALYDGYLRIVSGEVVAEVVVGQFIQYINFYYEGRCANNYLTSDISELLAEVVSRCEDVDRLKPFVDVIKGYDSGYFSVYLFYRKLNIIAPDVFIKIITLDSLRSIFDILSGWNGEYKEYVGLCFSLSRMLSGIDDGSAKEYFYMGINDGALRHGWRKDTLVSYSLVEALEVLWSMNAASSKVLINYTTDVFDLTRRVVGITDGKGTSRGPYNVLDMISKYDHNHAEYLFEQLDENTWQANFAVSSIIKSKVRFGVELDDVYAYFSKFSKYLKYRDEIDSDYYNLQLSCLVCIARSFMYTDGEKKDAFDRATKLLGESIKSKNVDLSSVGSDSVKRDYNYLCDLYGVDEYFDLSGQKDGGEDTQGNISEDEFVQRVNSSTTVEDIEGLYGLLSDYQNGIIISEKKSWEEIINKTQHVLGNIDPFIDLLKSSHYPHSDFFSRNSKYYHIALSVALTNISTKDQIFMYLKDNTGHGGFCSLIKAYSIHNDKSMCLSLFGRYIQLCNLLVEK